jgi:hypothetical protein
VLGTLGAEDTRRVDEAIATSAALQRAVDEAREAFTQAGAALAPVTPGPELRRRILASLSEPDRFRPFFAALCRMLALPLSAVRTLLRKLDEGAGWKVIVPGIEVLPIAAGPSLGADATFLRLRPGTRFPRHEHVGSEEALVLAGTGHDQGQVYGPGDVITYPPGTQHEFFAGEGRDLVLVVVHHGVKFV